MNDLILETLQSDVYGLLKAAPGLSDAVVFSANDGDIEAEVLRSLAPMTGEKRGLALVVLLPELVDAQENLPGPTMAAQIEVQVIESVVVNRAVGGTGLRASTAGLRALGVLHHLRVGNSVLYTPKNPMKPLPGKRGFITYVLTLNTGEISPSPTPKTEEVSFSLTAGGELELHGEAGATIYYTTDRGFPGDSNPDAATYTVPLEIVDGQSLRISATAPGKNPSGVSELTIRITGGETTLNGEPLYHGDPPLHL